MNTKNTLTDIDRIKNQLPYVSPLLEKELGNGSLSSFITQILQFGVLVFVFSSMVSLNSDSSDFEILSHSDVVSFMVIVGLLFGILAIVLPAMVQREVLQGTYKTLSLYPLSINTILLSKFLFFTLISIAITGITLFAIFTPLLLTEMVTTRYASYFFVMSFLMLLAYLVCMGTGLLTANFSAKKGSGRGLGSYPIIGCIIGFILSYWPSRGFFSLIFSLVDPGDRYLSEKTAIMIAEKLTYLSPFDLALHLSEIFILDYTPKLGYLICLPVWLTIMIYSLSEGKNVYLDIFFRRG